MTTKEIAQTRTPDKPAGLCAAVSAVMAEIRRLGKEHDNKFANYRYASSDDYRDHIRPLLAKNGLTVCSDELEFETSETLNAKQQKVMQARVQFAFWLKHSSGETEDPERMTVMLPFVGAQTTGQAKSYAQKFWLQGKFLMTSGDPLDDADSTASDGYSKTLPKAKGRAVYERLSGELRMLATKKAFDTWYATNKSDIDTLPEDWQALLRQEAHDKLHELKSNGNGAPKLSALPAEMEPNKALRNNLADSAFGDGYSSQIEEWRARLNLASRAEQAELFETEIDPRNEAGGIFPKDYNSLLGLIKNA